MALTGAATLAPAKSATWSTWLTCTRITFNFEKEHLSGEGSMKVKDSTRSKLLRRRLVEPCVKRAMFEGSKFAGGEIPFSVSVKLVWR